MLATEGRRQRKDTTDAGSEAVRRIIKIIFNMSESSGRSPDSKQSAGDPSVVLVGFFLFFFNDEGK